MPRSGIPSNASCRAVSSRRLLSGDRQKGRDRASSVTDTLADAFAIRSAIEMALNAPYCSIDNPYDQGPTSQKIVDILRQTDLSTLTEKAYHES